MTPRPVCFFPVHFVSFRFISFPSLFSYDSVLLCSFVIYIRSAVSRGISKNQYRRKARRGRKKIRYPVRLVPFYLFIVSTFSFFLFSLFLSLSLSLQRELRSREARLVPLRSPGGSMAIRINSIFEEQNSRGGCANLRPTKKRGRVYFLRSVARTRYSLCRYQLNNFFLRHTLA